MAEGYRAQVGNTVVLKAARRPSSVASALGEGMATLGNAGARLAETNRQTQEAISASEARIAEIEKNRFQAGAVATAAGALAEMQIRVDKRLRELPERSNPGSQGYAVAAQKVVDEELAGFSNGLPDDEEVRNHFAGPLASFKAQALTGAADYEDKQFALFQGDAYNQLLQVEQNRLAANPTGEGLDKAMATLEAVRGGMKLDGVRGPRLAVVTANALATSLLDGMGQKGDAAGLRKLVGGPTFDAVLTADQKGQYLKLADNLAAAAERQAELKQSAEQDKAREAIKLVRAKIDGGQDVPLSEINAALALGKNAGLPDSELVTAGNMTGDAVQDRLIRGLSTTVLEGQVRAMQAKRDAGKLKGEDARWLDRAEKALKDRGDNAGAKLAPLLKGGIEQRLAGVQQLAGMAPAERWRAADAAGDSRAAVIAGLSPRGQAMAVQGAALRETRGDDFLPPKSAGVTDPRKQVDAILKRTLGQGLIDDMGDRYDELRETALDVMASGSKGWSEKGFVNAFQAVAGLNRRGDGSWQGGIGTIAGKQTELPRQWNTAEFDRWYARQSFDGVTYSNGQPVTNPADVRRHYRLSVLDVMDNGVTVYGLMGPDGKLLHMQGEPYRLTVPPRPPVRGR